MDVYWLEQRQADVPESDEWLSSRERERLATLKFPKRRADWRLGRWTAKHAAARVLDGTYSLPTIEILADAAGIPRVLLEGEPVPLCISLSHSAGNAVCAVAGNGALGCDIETVADRGEAFLADYFSPNEQATITRSPDPALIATLMWSAKESALKALGEGLRRDTRSVIAEHIDLDLDSSWSRLAVGSETGESFKGWWYQADGLVRTLLAAPAPDLPQLVSAAPTSGLLAGQ